MKLKGRDKSRHVISSSSTSNRDLAEESKESAVRPLLDTGAETGGEGPAAAAAGAEEIAAAGRWSFTGSIVMMMMDDGDDDGQGEDGVER
jgi:hypothetical protein